MAKFPEDVEHSVPDGASAWVASAFAQIEECPWKAREAVTLLAREPDVAPTALRQAASIALRLRDFGLAADLLARVEVSGELADEGLKLACLELLLGRRERAAQLLSEEQDPSARRVKDALARGEDTLALSHALGLLVGREIQLKQAPSATTATTRPPPAGATTAAGTATPAIQTTLLPFAGELELLMTPSVLLSASMSESAVSHGASNLNPCVSGPGRIAFDRPVRFTPILQDQSVYVRTDYLAAASPWLRRDQQKLSFREHAVSITRLSGEGSVLITVPFGEPTELSLSSNDLLRIAPERLVSWTGTLFPMLSEASNVPRPKERTQELITLCGTASVTIIADSA